MRQVVSRIKLSQTYTDDMMIEDSIRETVEKKAQEHIKVTRLPATQSSPAEETYEWKGSDWIYVPLDHDPKPESLIPYTTFEYTGSAPGIGNIRVGLTFAGKTVINGKITLRYEVVEVSQL